MRKTAQQRLHNKAMLLKYWATEDEAGAYEGEFSTATNNAILENSSEKGLSEFEAIREGNIITYL